MRLAVHPFPAMLLAFLVGYSATTAADDTLSLEEIAPILKRNPCKADCKVQTASDEYFLQPIDLNGDGVFEYQVASTACGSAGCAEALYQNTPNGWKKLLGVSVGGLEIKNTRTNGYVDVLVTTASYTPQKHVVHSFYRWDGHAYKMTESPPADAQPSEQIKQSKTISQAPSEGSMQSHPTRASAVKKSKSESNGLPKIGRETRTSDGAILRIVNCGGPYQGVAVFTPESFDLERSTPSNKYRDADATDGIFPLAREALDFYWSVCTPQPGYAIRPPDHIWFFADQFPPENFGVAVSNYTRYIKIKVRGDNIKLSWKTTSWDVTNGLADLATKSEANRRKQEAERAKQAQIAAQREQSNARREAFLNQYGAIQIPKMVVLRSNPFSLEGKIIAIPVTFLQMHDATVGSFEVLTYSLDDRGGLIIVSGIPRGTFIQPTRAFLAAKVIGLTPVQGFGSVPHLRYAGVIICSNQKPFSSCP